MFIAHLPASYLMTLLVLTKPAFRTGRTKLLMHVGMGAAVLPDIDMLYFYLFDMRQHHHHTYWTHLPLFWLALLTPLALLLQHARNPLYAQATTIFGMNIFLHLLLDSVVGDIWWLSPFIDRPYALFTVPAAHGYWLLNFLLHWSFGIELMITAIAVICFMNGKKASVSVVMGK